MGRIVGSSASLVAAQAVRMSLGLVFWLVAARVFAPEEVGLAAAAISATMLCVLVAPLGAGSAFVMLLPRTPDHARALARTALVVAVLASLAVAGALLLVFGIATARLGAVAADPVWAIVFALACAGAALHEVSDELSVASWRARQAVVRAAAFGACGLAAIGVLLLAGIESGSRALYTAWALGAFAAALLAVAGYRALGRNVWPVEQGGGLRFRWMVGVGLRNHAVTIAERAPVLALPLLVAELLGATRNAYWYVAWMMALAVFTIPMQSGRVLFADVAARPEGAARAAGRAGAFALALGLGGAAVLAALAGPLLELLGDSYAREAVAPARILLAGVVPLVLVQAYVAISRGLGRLRELALAVGLFGLIALLAAGVAGARFGLAGVASGWVVVETVFAVFAALRIRAVLRPRSVPPALVAAR